MRGSVSFAYAGGGGAELIGGERDGIAIFE